MILNRYPTRETYDSLCRTGNVIPLCAELLADTETPVSILQKFYKKDQPLFLLESVEGGEHWARYSFMGISAKSQIVVLENDIEITSEDHREKIPHHGDPLAVLKKLTEKYQPADIKGLPRFWSGLTGYMTYEMVSFFENIQTHLPQGSAYAHFIIPDAMIIFDNMKHTLTCLSICYTDDKNKDTCYDEGITGLEKMIATIQGPTPAAVPSASSSSSPVHGAMPSPPDPSAFSLKSATDHDTYVKGVETIKEHIVEGDIIQAVYSQPFTSTAPVDPVMLYRAQRYINPSPYMFFMNMGDTAIAGSSPETMVRLENRTATLRPIAGTRPRGKTEQEDRRLADELLNDDKERAEHLMLVDLGRNDLGRVGETGTVQVTDMMFVERYSHVMHLVSNITCELEGKKDAWDLLRATFPAGTLSGAPKIRAMEIISALEQRPRGIYGGAAGYISFSGNMDLAITIRTATVREGKMTVQAGAGIVADSDPEKEYQECINKAKSVERALVLALGRDNGGESC
ncbi:anthranilate synthase, component I [Desulfocicer vacuolatum DSM 3385]|uniref:Anthranilate synthase component 1 n=1 Tax=Desulfocicer vacuolatum DSM 3385 TaxID=1121400 RepID=A0A1W2BEM8_9BACT|nr:anthranilate synthase component I family protein [Desulfocicer vacuolatum]SMC71356.1 anthranilate synthase, component I [Desulfocicer vacuolatum DSM 3385]